MASIYRGYSATWTETSEIENLASIFRRRYKSGTPILRPACLVITKPSTVVMKLQPIRFAQS